MIAQDTGTAIVGAVRGDVFWGAGNEAGEIAGWMKSRGRMFALLPVAVATRLPASGVAGK
jgi:membrane-bound lytic murein transglycosylase A